jgi:hypothetical protein
LQAAIVKRLMSIDLIRYTTSIKAWVVFVQRASRPRTDKFETLADYVPNRIIDAGELLVFWFEDVCLLH